MRRLARLLFIIVTVYRIPTLIRAFRDRTDQETTAETIWRSLAAERAWIQSATQQRANRWRAVAERKRRQRAAAEQGNANQDDDNDDNGDSPPGRRSRSRSAARQKSASKKKTAFKSPAPRSTSKSPSRRR